MVLRQAARRLLASVGSVTTTAPCVGLTFDDGPDPDTTPRVLDALARAGMSATFFMLAWRAEAAPELVGRVLADGHEIGLHGADHLALPEAPTAQVIRCIGGGRRRLEAVARVPIRLFRPPYGRQDLRAYAVARACRLSVVAWSVQVDDWRDQPPAAMAERARRSIAPGAVVLLHDGLVPTPGDPVPSFDRADAVGQLLDVLVDERLRGVTVSQLLATGDPVRFPWFL